MFDDKPACGREGVTQGYVDVFVRVVISAMVAHDHSLAGQADFESDRVHVPLVVAMVGKLERNSTADDVLTVVLQVLHLLPNALIEGLGRFDAVVVDAKGLFHDRFQSKGHTN